MLEVLIKLCCYFVINTHAFIKQSEHNFHFNCIFYICFQVFGYNEIRSGRFFTSGLEISLAVVDMANQFFKHKDYLKFELEKV